MTAPVIRPAAPTLAGVKRLADELVQLETEAAAVRERLTVAIKRAHGAGVANQNELAQAAGVSRQRIGQVVHGD